MRSGLLCLALLSLFSIGLTACDDTESGPLYDDSVDWSTQCGTLRTIMNDDSQLQVDRARALDLSMANCPAYMRE